MDYETFCANSQSIKAQAEELNETRLRIKRETLLNLAPRVASIGKSGFHYEMELQIAKIIELTVYPYKPNGNNYRKIEDEIARLVTVEVIFESLKEDLEKAETSEGKNTDYIGNFCLVKYYLAYNVFIGLSALILSNFVSANCFFYGLATLMGMSLIAFFIQKSGIKQAEKPSDE